MEVWVYGRVGKGNPNIERRTPNFERGLAKPEIFLDMDCVRLDAALYQAA